MYCVIDTQLSLQLNLVLVNAPLLFVLIHEENFSLSQQASIKFQKHRL